MYERRKSQFECLYILHYLELFSYSLETRVPSIALELWVWANVKLLGLSQSTSRSPSGVSDRGGSDRVLNERNARPAGPVRAACFARPESHKLGSVGGMSFFLPALLQDSCFWVCGGTVQGHVSP